MYIKMSQRIKLNVGGQLFTTTKETLIQSAYFEALLNRWPPEEEIFIDRSPHIFKHVLSLLRDPTYTYPMKYASELNFYGIDAEVATDPLSIINKNIAELYKILRDIEFNTRS